MLSSAQALGWFLLGVIAAGVIALVLFCVGMARLQDASDDAHGGS